MYIANHLSVCMMSYISSYIPHSHCEVDEYCAFEPKKSECPSTITSSE